MKDPPDGSPEAAGRVASRPFAMCGPLYQLDPQERAMPTSLPRDPDEQPEYGVPSPDLVARAAEGFERFLARAENNVAADEENPR
ncbi:hypothetical protein GCM10015535_58500 [Streptomyces gelaticus]|uniref:Uncharacterized protein n=1 Tax=Streptomyces gelaticus TaxID=285446 RepID=A0ABQ2W716_9ACTN|nr:hypothetical protein GCM10015535_58500 [Streptomyces gelaticus]